MMTEAHFAELCLTTAVFQPGPAQPTTPVEEPDILITWDRWSGWARIASHYRGSPDLPRFIRFLHLPASDPEALRELIDKAGHTVLSASDRDDQLTELRFAPAKAVAA
jgi:hypothetical protein